jgi:pimeloyl-ACP methyl ester carboxylesterase
MFFREVVRMPDEQLDAFRTLPAWQARLTVAHTIAREHQATAAFRFDQARLTTSTPTLLLAGGDSPEFLRASTNALADALPNARIEVLEGQQHAAMDTAPELFVDAVAKFLWR